MRIALLWVVLVFGTAAGCRLFEPGPAGDAVREATGEAIRRTVPAPWGELAALAVTGAAGLIAESKRRSANREHKTAEAAMTGLEEVYVAQKAKAEAGDASAVIAVAALKQAKQAAKKRSEMFQVPAAFEDTVAEVKRKNGFSVGGAK